MFFNVEYHSTSFHKSLVNTVHMYPLNHKGSGRKILLGTQKEKQKYMVTTLMTIINRYFKNFMSYLPHRVVMRVKSDRACRELSTVPGTC